MMICENLINFKRMSLKGTYSTSLHPKFEKDVALLQKNSRIEKAKKIKEIIEVRTILVLQNSIKTIHINMNIYIDRYIACHFY